MEIELEHDHPLAQAIQNWNPGSDLWLVLKEPRPYGESEFRARLSTWTRRRDSGKLVATFQSWEEFMTQQAKLQGI
ncbi:Uncharacterised protein [Mycobacteroides abscessus subsp. abscessus]|nr:Uncharacterised protein [Mycobacteroides abscessus subsp. abscessus]SHY07711.1 Uncharacterised protein [Mycobacteroides abscessus subsp. abscessus]SIC43281.1 Uncharacterised protein [Mycobacteroides abscessus subsp. abscessus]SID65885.1 Uncharacterised protein [Mycobacteroides abscessus subsp. abscessus]SIF02717.1 Uncharacterised protein [Mycobacteroides abscessus subsp. abscessus]